MAPDLLVMLCGERFKSCPVDLTSRSGICSPGPRRQSPIGERAEREYKSDRGASKCKHARYCTLETRLSLNVPLERTSNSQHCSAVSYRLRIQMLR